MFSRLFALFGTEGPQALHAQVVAKAKALSVARGHCLRTDTSAVETNIHHPSDSSLLADSLRVLTRSLKTIRRSCQQGGESGRSCPREQVSASGDRPGG